MSNESGCPVCKTENVQCGWLGGQDTFLVDCARCGRFYMSGTMISALGHTTDKDRFAASVYLRERHLKNLPPPIISTGKNEGKSVPEGSYTIGWDAIVSEAFPHSISEKMDRTLLNFSRMEDPGKWIKITAPQDWAVAYAADEDSWKFIVNQLREDRFIEFDNIHSSILLTIRGWNRVVEIERGIVASQCKQAFVAMWFDKSLDVAWESGFKPGIETGTGIKAMRVDLKEHNEKICDVIVAEIRKSSFLVADFTGDRGGVYFEAGFAKGLGIPVIFSCQKGEWEEKLHFDTRQYNHIIWETPEDLKNKLKNRIMATIPTVGGLYV